MKLIEKIEKELKEKGFKVSIETFADKSGSWIDIFTSKKNMNKSKSIGSIGFNYKGTKITDVSWHLHERAFTLKKV